MLSVLLMGFVFRFAHLDRKVYWHDEAYTSLRISGYTSAEVKQDIFQGQVISIEDLQKYQRPNPEKSLTDTVKTLIIEDSQHPPFYYILVRLWAQGFGHSVAVIRILSALISLLILPCVYYLCLELFDLSLVGWLAICLISISPFHVLYAQEAREYSLWTVMILLSSWALLRALRLTVQNEGIGLQNWGIYALTLALSLYTSSLSLLVGMAQGIYVITREHFRLTKTLIAYFLSSIIALLAFAPWLAIIIATWSQTGSTWTAIPIPWIDWIKTWGLHVNRAFILTVGDFGFDHLSTYLTLPIFLILVGYAIYCLCRQTALKVWLFVLCLMGIPSLALALPDLILGGQRSMATRYLIPFLLGIEISLAYLFATQLTSRGLFKQRLWYMIMAGVISCGIISCNISFLAETSWNKVVSYNNHQVARIINQSNAPLLISNSYGMNFGNILALSYLLNSKVRLQLINDNPQTGFSDVPKIPQNFSDVFLLNLPDPLRESIEKQYGWKLSLIFNDSHLWLWKRENL
ncbi:putative membrane protein [Allocoleopsis franciscana PCC 7113]|uniref:Putative membrane protein n=2 Tax=Allocoleopsis TaxID=2886347 RepID=K9WIZ8_9CYAN|nr:putative membrane protein [Allocoleopsis franciscana PCC 7113]